MVLTLGLFLISAAALLATLLYQLKHEGLLIILFLLVLFFQISTLSLLLTLEIIFVPLYKLSTKYVAISTDPTGFWPSQFAVAAIEDNTTTSINFKMKRNLPLNIEGNTFYNGVVFNFSLDRFETYQIEHCTDLTGTLIESSVPIAAFSGNDCNWLENIGGCDHLIEQLPPTDSVDKTYIVPPNSNYRDTLIRITAIENANITYVIGGVTQTRSLNKFDSFNTKISSSQTCFIKSDTPILVTAFGLNSKSSS